MKCPVALLALVAIGLAAGIVFYFRSVRVTEIHYVFPPGFHGRFWVYEVPDGERLRPHYGVVTVNVPPSGLAKAHDIRCYEQWHTTSASDQAGRKVADDLGEMRPRFTTAVEEFGAGSYGSAPNALNYTSGFFGTRPEIDALRKNSDDTFGLDELLKKLGRPPPSAPSP